jgi:Holliday junction resolvasome RuvABC endonuclease subunit
VILLGCDPGLATFGAVLVDAREMRVLKIDAWSNPATPKKQRPKGERMVRTRELANWLVAFIGDHDIALCATEALAGSAGVNVAMNVALGFGVLSGVLAVLDVPSIAAGPREWRGPLVPNCDEDVAHSVALERFSCYSRAELLAEIDEKLEPHALDALGVAAWACETPFIRNLLAERTRQAELPV